MSAPGTDAGAGAASVVPAATASFGATLGETERRLYGRLRVAGLLVVFGLVIQVLTLLSPPRATAFMIFATFGVTLVGLGVLWFLWAIVRAR